MKDINQFIAEQGLRLHDVKPMDKDSREARIKDGWPKDAKHFFVHIRKDGEHWSMKISYSMGSALRGGVKLPDVLDSLAIDAATVDSELGFEEWASDLGFDPDSRKAEHAYERCLAYTRNLRRMLGNEAYAELLHKVERL